MAYISSGMSDADINSVLGLRQSLEAQRRNQNPLDDEQLQRAVTQGQRAGQLAAGVPGVDSAATGWQNPAGAAPGASPAPPAPAAQGGGAISASSASPLGPAVPSNMGNVDWNATGMTPIRGANGSIAGYGSDSFNVGLGNHGTGNDTVDRMFGQGTYAGYLPGQYQNPAMMALTPEQRFQTANQMQQTGIQQQAENRLRTSLLGGSGQPGAMELNARNQALQENVHSYNSNQAVANQATYRQYLAQHPESTQEDRTRFWNSLPWNSPANIPPAPGAGQPVAPTGGPPTSTTTTPTGGGPPPAPGGGAPITHPWSQIQGPLDSTFQQASTQAGVAPGPGGPGAPNAAQAQQIMTNFVHALAGNGVQLTPENSLAIRQYLVGKFGPEATEAWWQTRDSALPDLGLGTENAGAVARRMMRQAAGQGASASNIHTPFLSRLFSFADLFGNRQYR